MRSMRYHGCAGTYGVYAPLSSFGDQLLLKHYFGMSPKLPVIAVLGCYKDS